MPAQFLFQVGIWIPGPSCFAIFPSLIFLLQSFVSFEISMFTYYFYKNNFNVHFGSLFRTVS